MARRIQCLLGLHSWSGRVCCKCGAKKGEKRLRQGRVEGLKTLHFPVDLYNHGVRLFNAGKADDAKDVFLHVYNHPGVTPSFRWIAVGGLAVASKLINSKEPVSSKKEDTEIPKEFIDDQQKAIAVFILVNLVRSIDPTVEAVTIRTDPSTRQLETDFSQKGRQYRCSITITSSEYRGQLWSFENGELISLTDAKTTPPPCHEDDVVKGIYRDWLAIRPKLPLLPINFVLDLGRDTSRKTV